MIYTIDKIISDVRVAMDLGNAHQSIIDEGDDCALTVDRAIRANIVEGVRQVHLEAEATDLCGGHNFGDALYWDCLDEGSCSGHVLLPEDFMRLVSFQMSDWVMPCRQAVDTSSAEYALQHSRWSGLRGHTEHPVVAIVPRAEGNALEFYSCLSPDATVVQAMYMPYPVIDSYGGIDIAPRCYTAAISRIAALASEK